eukprot:m.110543 g.110543  ORF g.110543 m.110543 type:complete len:267 (-) comp22727_c0_seq1:75-875(-)
METPFVVALMAGGCAGITVDVCLFPLDTLKTRLQAEAGFRQAGGFRGIYRGLLATAAGSGPSAAAFFGTYETTRKYLNKAFPQHTHFNPMACASAGEAVSAIVRVPFELVKQKMQAGVYQATSVAVKDIFQRHGLRGFFQGYSATVAREIPFSFLQFPMYEYFKHLVRERSGLDKEIPAWQAACCGSVSGTISAFATCPVDVVKTRSMLAQNSQTMTSIATKVLQTEGFLALFSGVGPRCLWIGLGGFVFFGAYEQSKLVLGSVLS